MSILSNTDKELTIYNEEFVLITIQYAVIFPCAFYCYCLRKLYSLCKTVSTSTLLFTFIVFLIFKRKIKLKYDTECSLEKL